MTDKKCIKKADVLLHHFRVETSKFILRINVTTIITKQFFLFHPQTNAAQLKSLTSSVPPSDFFRNVQLSISDVDFPVPIDPLITTKFSFSRFSTTALMACIITISSFT